MSTQRSRTKLRQTPNPISAATAATATGADASAVHPLGQGSPVRGSPVRGLARRPILASTRPALRRLARRGGGVASLRADSGAPAIQTWGWRLSAIIVLVWASSLLLGEGGYRIALTILSMIGLAAAILAWRSPAIALLGIAILFAIDPMTRVYLLTGGILRWNTLNYWMVVVILLYIPFMLRLRDPHTRLLQAFLIVLALGLLISPRKTTGLLDILSLLSIFGLYVYFARVLKEEQTFYWIGIVVGVLGAAGDFVYYLQKANLDYINPNAKAVFPVTALFAIVMAFPYARNYHRGRLILLLLAAINALWVFLSGSRGNMLVGALCLLFLFFLTRSVSWTTLFVTAGLLVGMYLSYTFLEDQLYARGRIERFFDPSYTLAERTSGRSNLALAGWLLFVDHPLGVGTGGFRAYAGEFDILEYHEKPAHSGWVKTLAENGIPGILLMLAYVASFAVVGAASRRTGFRSRPPSAGAIAALKEADPLVQDWRLIGLLVTLCMAAGYISTEFQNKGLFFLAAGATVFLHRAAFLENLQIGGKLPKGQRLGRGWYLRGKIHAEHVHTVAPLTVARQRLRRRKD